MHAEDDLEAARSLYLQGVEAERNGRVYDAIYFYRRAVQLVPDIEFRATEFLPAFKKGEDEEERYSSDEESAEENGLDADEEEEGRTDNEGLLDEDLVSRFFRSYNKTGKVCQPVFDQKASHISVLPKEILIYIYKWVVSSDLDMRSLEQLALVCRGFYVFSRESELWRLACLRVWGDNCGLPNSYGSWREMFIKRPRLRFNGAYISKTTYIRPGEPAFQDQTYRPWHIVDYYRYLRFFPEGIVLMMTTPDEPMASLSSLRQKSVKHQAILSGRYHLVGNRVTAIMKRTSGSAAVDVSSRYRRSRMQAQPIDYGEQTFLVELEVITYKKTANYKLEWRGYSVSTVYRNGETSTTSEFELSHNNFPPFWFSRVKSYTATSERPLQ